MLDAVDVVRGARDQVARARALDGGQGEGRDGLDQVLAQLGEHRLAEHHGQPLRVPAQHGLRDDRARADGDDGRHVRGRGAVRDGVDEAAEQPRPDEARDGGERVEHRDEHERAAVAGEEPPGGGADGGAVGDGEPHEVPPAGAVRASAGASSSERPTTRR